MLRKVEELGGAVQPRVFSHQERLRVITGIVLCIFLAALDQTVVLPAIPQISANLGGAKHLSWVVSAYLLTTTATTPIYGKLSDQLGRRRVLGPALVLFMLASTFCAISPSVTALIAARALQGIGGGALMAVAQAAVADVVPPRERGKYQGWFAGAWAVSSLVGPVAGGFVTETLSWRWIFWANLPLGAMALMLSMRGLAGLKPVGLRQKIDYAGALLTILAVGAVLVGLSTGGVDFGWGSAQEFAVLLFAGVSFTGLIWQQRYNAHPLFPGGLLAKGAFRAVLGVAFLSSAALFGAIFMFPLMLHALFQQSPGTSGVAIVPFLFTTTAGAFVAGRVMRKTGRSRTVILTGTGTAAIGYTVLALVPPACGMAYPIVISALFGFGVGLIMPSCLVAAQNQAMGRDIGAATGTLLLLRAMGGAFGATIAGAVLVLSGGDNAPGFRDGFLSCALMLAVATVIAWRMQDVALRDSN